MDVLMHVLRIECRHVPKGGLFPCPITKLAVMLLPAEFQEPSCPAGISSATRYCRCSWQQRLFASISGKLKSGRPVLQHNIWYIRRKFDSNVFFFQHSDKFYYPCYQWMNILGSTYFFITSWKVFSLYVPGSGSVESLQISRQTQSKVLRLQRRNFFVYVGVEIVRFLTRPVTWLAVISSFA